MANKRDYYEVLGIARDASERDIARAYRQLAIKYHPDSHPDDAEATERFKEAAEAYEVLSDAEKRARYDQFGHAGMAGGGQGQYADMDDIFEAMGDIFGGGIFGEMFGSRGGRRRSRVQRGGDVKCEVSLTLVEAARGVNRKVQFERSELCGRCRGSGSKAGSPAESCRRCSGRGKVVTAAGILRVETVCPDCHGAGQVIVDPCDGCRGRGFVARAVELEVAIPAGVDEGMRIRLAGEGEPGRNGGPAGDCYCFIRVLPHPLFRREGTHLYVELPISYTQAALGAEMDIPTLEGSSPLAVPAGTQSGDVFRMKGKGMQDPRGGSTGDLLVQTYIEVPKKLQPKEEGLLRELAELEHRNVSPRRKGFLDKLREYISPTE